MKSSDFETKSLLYLAARSPKYKKITYLAVDCFNDVSGLADDQSIWDVQSKNEQKLTPRKIGTYLISLYDNYCSPFRLFFREYILFIPQVQSSYLINPEIHVFDISNFIEKEKLKVLDGLMSKIKINAGELSFDSDFFKRLIFVSDNSEGKDYVKNVMKFKTRRILKDVFYQSIFDEVRNHQTALKNSEIENESISMPNQVKMFNRFITTQELQVFILNRFIGGDIFNSVKQIPRSYLSVVRTFDDDQIEDHLQRQYTALSRAFFDKNNKDNFWKLFKRIYEVIADDPSVKILSISEKINDKDITNTMHLDRESVVFLISLIKDGLNDDNT